MNRFQENVAALPNYTVDQDLSRIKLNQNESPRDVPQPFKEEIWRKLVTRSWNRYPPAQNRSLEERLSAYSGFPASGILIGNGSNELILTLLIAACGQGGSVLTVKPGFSIYKRMAGLLPARLIEVPLNGDFSFDLQAILERAGDARLVFLASPNNPTGTALAPEEIGMIAGRTEGFLVVDEAYYEFSGRTVQTLIGEKENIVVLRTFSKAWRLAGARLGYLLGREELVRQAAKVRLPFSVSLFAQAAAEVMLDHRDELARSCREIREERDGVFQALKKIRGIVPVPSSANFILFSAADRAAAVLHKQLRDRGVEVRVFDDPALEKHLRVTIGTAAENSAFLSALRDIMKEARL